MRAAACAAGLLLALLPRPGGAAEPAVPVTLGEAVQIALASSYAVQLERQSLETADAQIEQAWGTVYPSLDLAARYVRNVEVADPFAGSSAGALFGGFDALGWLAFNEQARVDGDPGTEPISLPEYQRRVSEGRAAAGLGGGGGDVFLVENQFSATLSLTQTLYNGAAFAAIRGARAFRSQREAGVARVQHQVLREVVQAFYRALLAEARLGVLDNAVQRARETLEETSRRVSQGVAPQFEQLSVEVELANLETERTTAGTQAEATRDALKLLLGLPPGQAVVPRGALRRAEAIPEPAELERAVGLALERRPDLVEVRRGIDALQVRAEITGSEYTPLVSAFVNLGLVGSVPDDRSRAVGDPTDPFVFRKETPGFFSDDYWFRTLNLGVMLSWNLFNGFQTGARVEQDRIDVRRARTQQAQLEQAIRIEVEQAIRELAAARARIEVQRRNVARAELSYEHARARVREGVSTQVELRDVSQQLDASRFNELQAHHDYLVAWTQYEVATGTPPGEMPALAAPAPEVSP